MSLFILAPKKGATLPTLERRCYPARLLVHQHSFHQVVLPSSGAMEIDFGGVGGRVDAQFGAFIASGTPHAFHAKPNSDFVVLDVDGFMMCGLYNGKATVEDGRKSVFFPITSPLRHLIGYASSMNLRAEAGGPVKEWSALLLACLFAGSESAPRIRSATLKRAVACIEDRLDTTLSVRDIARAAGVSERSLHAMFRSELDVSPHAFLAWRRAERALDLLAHTCKSVPEIAVLTGYVDQSALTRSLRKFHSTTPAAYRRDVRGKISGI